MTGFRVSLDMEAVAVWVADADYGTFKIAHVFRPKINEFLMEKEGERYESAMRNTYQANLNGAVRRSLDDLAKRGKFRGGGNTEVARVHLEYRPVMEG